MTGSIEIAAQTRTGASPIAYPGLFRIFAGSIVVAALCGFAAVATEGGKGLHPAPFLALATLCAIAAAFAFIAMLMHLTGEAILIRWRRGHGPWRGQGR